MMCAGWMRRDEERVYRIEDERPAKAGRKSAARAT
jgi:hypothetical protein